MPAARRSTSKTPAKSTSRSTTRSGSRSTARSGTRSSARSGARSGGGVRARASATSAATRREVEQSIARFEKRLDEANDALKALGGHLGSGARGSYKEVTTALAALRRNAARTNKQALKDFDKLRVALTKANSSTGSGRSTSRSSSSRSSGSRSSGSRSTSARSTASRSTGKRSTSSRSTASRSTRSRAKKS